MMLIDRTFQERQARIDSEFKTQENALLLERQEIERKAELDRLKAENERLKASSQIQKPQVASTGYYQPPLKMYPIKTEKPELAFNILDEHGNTLPLPDNKYVEQAFDYLNKMGYKIQQPKQRTDPQFSRINKLESKVNKIGDTVIRTNETMEDLVARFNKMHITPRNCSICGQSGHTKKNCPQQNQRSQEEIAANNTQWDYRPSLPSRNIHTNYQRHNYFDDEDEAYSSSDDSENVYYINEAEKRKWNDNDFYKKKSY